MSDEKKKKIESALDRMESEYAVRAQENRKVRVVEKHGYKKEIEEVKKVKVERAIEEKELKEFEFRSTTTQVVLGMIAVIIAVWGLSRDQRTTLIEYCIYIICVAGIVAAKKKR